MGYLERLFVLYNVSSWDNLPLAGKKKFCHWYVHHDKGNTNVTFDLDCTGLEGDAHKQLHPYWTEKHPIVLLTFVVFLCLLGVIMDTLFIVMLARNKKLYTTQNIMVVNIAAAGILLQTFGLPLSLSRLIFSDWVYGGVPCILLHYVSLVTDYVICFCVIYLCFLLCLQVYSPQNAVKVDRQRYALVASVVIWVIGLLMHIWYVSGLKYVERRLPSGSMRFCYNDHITSKLRAYFIVKFILLGIVPLVAMSSAVGYAIYRLLTKTSGFYQHMTDEDRRKRRQLVMALALLITSAVLRIPHKVFEVLTIFVDTWSKEHTIASKTFEVFQLAIPTCNALILAFFIPELLPGILRSLCCNRKLTASSASHQEPMNELHNPTDQNQN